MRMWPQPLLALPLVLGACAGADPGGARSDAGDAAGLDAAVHVPDAGPRPEGAVTAVSLNLRCLIDGWDQRLPIIAGELAGLDPDLIGLQEGCVGGGRDNVGELKAALEAASSKRYQVLWRPTHRAWDMYDEGIAALSALPVLDTADVPLPAGAFPRAVVLMRVQGPKAPWVFGTTHFDHQDGLVRLRQAEAAVRALGDFAPDAAPVLLTGDFNAPPSGPVQPIFTAAGYTDVWAALHPTEGGETFPARSPAERIDYLFLRGGEARAVTRILRDPVGGVTGSDHLGLFGVLTGP